jgi:hypothetical protein
MIQAVVWNPAELLNKSMHIPRKKLAAKSPVLLPLTGNKMIKRIYGYGLI